MPSPLVPRLAVPLEMGPRGFKTVEQDSVDDVAGCVYALLATDYGSRLEQPEYGVDDPTFDQLPVDTSPWAFAIEEWEPRATATIGQELDGGVDRIRVAVAAA